MNPGGVLDFNLQLLTGMLTLLGFIAIFFTLRNRSEEAELRRLLDKLQTKLPSPEQQIRRSNYLNNWKDDREAALGLLTEFMDTIRDNARRVEADFRGYANKYQELVEEALSIKYAVRMCNYLLGFSAIVAINSFFIATVGEKNDKLLCGIPLILLLIVLFWIYSHLDRVFRLNNKYPSLRDLLNVEYIEKSGLINTSLFYNTIGIYLKLMHDVGDKGPRKGFLISLLLPVPFYNFTIIPIINYKVGEEFRRYELKERYTVPLDTDVVNCLKGANDRADIRIDFFHVVEGLQELDVKEILAHLENLYISIRVELKIDGEIKYTEFVISNSFLEHMSNPEVRPNIYWGTFVLFGTTQSLSESESKRIFDQDSIEIDKRQ